jgi:hypothetical protein
MRAAAKRAENSQFLDLFAEDSWRNVYAGDREVRPPGAPTTAAQKSVVSYGIWSGIREPQETGAISADANAALSNATSDWL